MGTEEVVQELGRCQNRPHPLEGLAYRQLTTQALTQALGVQVATAALCHHREELGLDEAPGGVVGPEAAPGLGDDRCGGSSGNREPLQAMADADIVTKRLLAGACRPGDHADHPEVALQAGHVLVVTGVGDTNTADHVPEGGELHPGLTERGKHLLDVREEQAIGPHHQHPLALKREPVRVEQVGSPVESHDRLAGSGATLDGKHTGQRRSDYLVLFGLDRSDDVSESTCPGRFEGCDQGPLAAKSTAVTGAEPLKVTEELVLEADDRAAPAHEVTAPAQAHRNRTGCPVEGLGDGSTPVDNDRFLVVVPDTYTSDVEAALADLGFLVDPAKDEGRVAEVQLLQTERHGTPDGLALEPGLVCAAATDLDHRHQLEGTVARLVEAPVCVVDKGLFGLEFRMDRYNLLHRDRPLRSPRRARIPNSAED
ncbi:MAG: hypothetical protein MAG471_01149 [Acidimicrobiaceae bacterium]|nr:hypothetical protein [Acidimicrobiaceae bacterium]